MSRPPAVPRDAYVDADVCARAGTRIERRFSAADLPRLSEAGVGAGSRVAASFQFVRFDGLPAVDGALQGSIVTTCQRCMKEVTIPLQERFQVVIVSEERGEEPGGYEPVVADASRLDLRWLTEEQVLLALPLAPMHESDDCREPAAAQPPQDGAAAPEGARDDVGEDVESARQKPFQNLRDMLRQR